MSSGMSVQYSSSSSADHSRYIASSLSTPEPEAAGGQRVPFHYTARLQFVATEPAMAGHLRSAPSCVARFVETEIAAARLADRSN